MWRSENIDCLAGAPLVITVPVVVEDTGSRRQSSLTDSKCSNDDVHREAADSPSSGSARQLSDFHSSC